jgi:hypothetical protein
VQYIIQKGGTENKTRRYSPHDATVRVKEGSAVKIVGQNIRKKFVFKIGTSKSVRSNSLKQLLVNKQWGALVKGPFCDHTTHKSNCLPSCAQQQFSKQFMRINTWAVRDSDKQLLRCST